MTKKDAAVQVWGVARRLREHARGDEVIDQAASSLIYLARELDPHRELFADAQIEWMMDESVSIKVKLRNLIEHTATSAEERDAAVRALNRIKEKEAAEDA